MKKQKEFPATKSNYQSFTKNLNLYLSMLFSKGVYKPIDITVCLLIHCALEGKNGVLEYYSIMDKLSITEEEILESIERLKERGVLSSQSINDHPQ